MNRHTTMSLMTLALTLLLIAPAGAQKPSEGRIALEVAKQRETLNGDLDAAIKQYDVLARQYTKTDPSVAAMALFYMAEAYARQGDTGSRRTYQRIVDEFPGQKEAVTLAQARLGVSPPTGPNTVWTPPSVPNAWGRISPDGRFVSYSDGDLFVHEFVTGQDHNLTNRPNRSSGAAAESVISPDGKQIAFVWRRDNRYSVSLANLIGDPKPQLLYDNPDISYIFLSDWSQDCKCLAVEVHRIDKTAQIALLSVPDGKLTALKSLDSQSTYIPSMYAMYFSRDGKYLGYDQRISNASQKRDIFLLAIDDKSLTPVVTLPGTNQMVGWSPDGKWLLFKSDRYDRVVDLWAIAFSNGKTQGMPQQLQPDWAKFRQLGWTISGAFYYQTTEERFGVFFSSGIQLASVDFAAGKFLSAPLPLLRGESEDTGSPTWSPDGKRLAYTSRLRGDRNSEEIVIRAVYTGAITELRPLDSISAIDGWMPDGRSLIVYGSDRQGRVGKYRVDAATGEASAVVLNRAPDTIFSYYIVWMPGGRSFLTWAEGRKPGVYKVDSQTGDVSLLDQNLSGESFPNVPLEFSPTGETIYHHQRFPATSEVAFVGRNLATGKETELFRRKDYGANLTGFRLSPDGQYFATHTIDAASNSRVVLLIPTAGGPPRELLRVPAGVKPEDLSNGKAGTWAFVYSWTDSRSLVLRETFNDPNKNDELWLVSLDGQKIGKIDLPLLNARWGLNVFLSPDYRYAAYVVREPAASPTAEVSILENFLPRPAPGK